MADSVHTRTVMIKKAIEHNLEIFNGVKISQEEINIMVSKGVLEWSEKEKLERKLDREGQMSQVNLLLTLVMAKDNLDQLEGFLEALAERQVPLHTVLLSTIERIRDRGIKLYDFNLVDVAKQIREVYSEDSWSRVEPIPGVKDVFLYPENQKALMTPVFEVQKLQVYRKAKSSNDMVHFKYENCCMSTKYFGRLDSLIEHAKAPASFEMDDCGLLHQPHLLEITGIAGCGKTTAMLNLVWLWTNERSAYLQKFDLLLMIPISSVKFNRIVDILNDLGLCDTQRKDTLDYYLSDPANASRCLFIIDGVDERSYSEGSEIYQLIKGEIYKGATVIITGRQEVQGRPYLSYMKPKIKVTLKGTDEASVHRFMSVYIKGQSPKTLESLKMKLKTKLYDFTLLFIPLYLTLICFVLNERDVQMISVKDYQVPQTMTALFNTFLCVIVRRWLKRVGREDMNVSFKTSPLGRDSSVPCDIKRTLLAIGKLCFEGLMREKYGFSTEDAADSLLDMADVQNSGLFHVGKCSRLFYTKHKQFQEYLAALYLAHDGMEIHSFSNILNQRYSAKPTLFGMMNKCKLIKVIHFSCGLSPDFFMKLFQHVEDICSIAKFHNGSYDISFEAMLYREVSVCDAVKAKDTLKHYLLHCGIQDMNATFHDIHGADLVLDEMCLEDAVAAFDISEASQLLNKLYAMDISGRSMPHPSSEEMAVCAHVSADENVKPLCTSLVTLKLCLGQLQKQLLQKVVIGNVREVTVDNGEDHVYIDMCSLLMTFPGLVKLNIQGNLHMSHSVPETIPCTNLSEMTLHDTNRQCDCPRAVVSFIFKQKHLQSLTLTNIDVLSIAAVMDETPEWDMMKQLRLVTGEDITSRHFQGLNTILAATTSALENLTLSWKVKPGTNDAFLVSGLSPLHCLTSLEISLGSQSALIGSVLSQVLPSLTSLRQLHIVENEIITNQEDILVNAMCNSKSLSSVILQKIVYTKPYILPHAVIEKLQRSGIVVEKKAH